MAFVRLPSIAAGLIAVLLVGCEHPHQAKPVPAVDVQAGVPAVAIESESPAAAITFAEAGGRPEADAPRRQQYYIQILKPDPMVDYKIMRIPPDPKKEYFIRNLGIDDFSAGRDGASPEGPKTEKARPELPPAAVE